VGVDIDDDQIRPAVGFPAIVGLGNSAVLSGITDAPPSACGYP
jgi:hypothetical protein